MLSFVCLLALLIVVHGEIGSLNYQLCVYTSVSTPTVYSAGCTSNSCYEEGKTEEGVEYSFYGEQVFTDYSSCVAYQNGNGNSIYCRYSTTPVIHECTQPTQVCPKYWHDTTTPIGQGPQLFETDSDCSNFKNAATAGEIAPKKCVQRPGIGSDISPAMELISDIAAQWSAALLNDVDGAGTVTSIVAAGTATASFFCHKYWDFQEIAFSDLYVAACTKMISGLFRCDTDMGIPGCKPILNLDPDARLDQQRVARTLAGNDCPSANSQDCSGNGVCNYWTGECSCTDTSDTSNDCSPTTPDPHPDPDPDPSPVCFSSESLVTLMNGQRRKLTGVRPGDSVLGLDNSLNPMSTEIVANIPYAEGPVPLLKVSYSSLKGKKGEVENSLVVSRGHFVKIPTEAPSKIGEIAASELRVGSKIVTVSESGLRGVGWVVDVTQVEEAPMHPFTTSGNLVIDGVLVSCYTKTSNSVRTVLHGFFQVVAFARKYLHVAPGGHLEAVGQKVLMWIGKKMI